MGQAPRLWAGVAPVAPPGGPLAGVRDVVRLQRRELVVGRLGHRGEPRRLGGDGVLEEVAGGPPVPEPLVARDGVEPGAGAALGPVAEVVPALVAERVDDRD